MKRKKLEKKSLKAVIALAVALAFIMPGAAAFANVGTIGVTSNSENTGDIENIVEISTNSDNAETTTTPLPLGITIYVDDDADPGWYDATHVHTITEGITAASPGDTVYVYNGIYNECITVDKSINLIGESKDDTIIIDDGGGKVVAISADAFISNFTIKNGATVGIWITNRCNITNCICHDNKYGIAIFLVNYVNIASCTFDSTNTGLYLNGQYCTIKNCTFSNNPDYGIKLVGTTGYNEIYHNNFMNNGLNTETLGGGWYQIWDNGYPSGGNYWDTYDGVDEYHGPGQDIPGRDGIGDTAYQPPEEPVNQDGNDWDYYPLMNPWAPPEITDVTATPELQSVGGNINITCTVEDIHNGVKPAIVYITDPSSDQQGFEMTGINVDSLGNGEYYYNATYSMFGMYSYFIRAENWRDCGNESDVYQFEIEGSDTVPPVTNCTLMGTVGENDWYVSDVEVNLTVTDPPPSSGINYTTYNLDETNWTEYTNPFTVTTDGPHTVEYYSVDMAGNNESEPNWENLKSTSFKIDQTAPETSCELYPPEPDGENDWYVSDVEVTLNATDDNSGVNYTMYNLNGTGWIEYTVSFTMTTDGPHTVEYSSTDNVSNIEPTKSMDFKIDKTAPETSCELYPPEPDGENDWYVSDVEAKLTATDDTSEINYTMYKLDENDWTKYMNPFTVTTDEYHIVEYYSVDIAGNIESTKSVSFKIDQTPPTIKLTWDRKNSKLVADVNDETSGVNRVEFSVNGKYVGEDTTAPYEWEVTDPKRGDKGQAIVYDNAGNKEVSEEIDAVPQSQSQSNSNLVPVQRKDILDLPRWSDRDPKHTKKSLNSSPFFYFLSSEDFRMR